MLVVLLLAWTTRPVRPLTFCLVEVTSFISGLPASRRTAVPMPEPNDSVSIEVVFSQMSPPDWPLVIGGWGHVANMCATPAGSSRTTIGRVWLLETVPKVALLHVPLVLRRRSIVSGWEPELSLVLTAAKTRPWASALRLM